MYYREIYTYSIAQQLAREAAHALRDAGLTRHLAASMSSFTTITTINNNDKQY